MYPIGTSSSLKARIISVFLAFSCFLLFFLIVVKVKVQTQGTAAAAISFLIGGYLVLLVGTCKENLERISFAFKKVKEEILQALIGLSN